ncbi:hypothetical protein, conserved [Eimeria praecox]|uniref:AP2/ERF domain-containing protein n=1 Tax=Eimeria praecox TaxID=51316 RepID=U6G7T3_9EIME|nr:hypothetical protein, conserved [Eimeria praecox]
MQKYGSDHDSSCKASILPLSSYAKSSSYAGQRLVLPALPEPSAEDCTSDSSASTTGEAADSAPSRWLKNISTENGQGVSVEKELYSVTKYQKVTSKRVAVNQIEECPTKSNICSLFSPSRSSNTAQTTSPTWTSPSEKTVPGGLHSQWTASGSSKEQVACQSLGESPALCEGLEAFGASAGQPKGGIGVRCGTPMPSVEYLDDADDGRAWLDHLEKLRGGAPKEEYKRERSRVVDALIRRAATYPKVSGIYFDKHQLRWSVGWAHNGRRAAKYFPVKLFGMREGYDMAVSFKSTKTLPMEPSAPLLANPVQAAEAPASSIRCNESSTNRAVLGGVPVSRVDKSLVSLAADAPVTLSLRPQATIAGPPSLSNRAWSEKIQVCPPCFPGMPLAASCLMPTANRQALPEGQTTDVSGANTTRTGIRLPSCSAETPMPSSQIISHSAGSNKEENVGQVLGDQASAPGSPDRATQGTLHSLACFRPTDSQWQCTSVGEMDQLKLPDSCTVVGEKTDLQAVAEGRLIASDAYTNRTQGSMSQNALKASIQERELPLGSTVRYDRLRMHHVQQMHHTPGIHFDKHSLRWKATWYDISGHRKAKYFPIATGTAADASADVPISTLSSLADGGYDEERDRRLSKAPSRVLIRHASRLTRVPGIWFDKKQLRWACTFTDVQSGKRRAEYFPIRHFGFLGARLLAVNARKKMERFRSQASASAQSSEKIKKETLSQHDSSCVEDGTMGEVNSFESHVAKEAGTEDLWNKYVVEILQRTDAHKDLHFSTTEATFFTLGGGSLRAADELICSGTDWDRGGLLTTHSETILSLGREAIRFLLCDLRTHCLSDPTSGLSARESVSHMKT